MSILREKISVHSTLGAWGTDKDSLGDDTHSWVMYFFLHNYTGFYTCVTLCTVLYASNLHVVRNYVQFCI